MSIKRKYMVVYNWVKGNETGIGRYFINATDKFLTEEGILECEKAIKESEDLSNCMVSNIITMNE